MEKFDQTVKELKTYSRDIKDLMEGNSDQMKHEIAEIKENFTESIDKISATVESRLLVHIKRDFIDRDELNSWLWLKADRHDIEMLDRSKADLTVSQENIAGLNLLFKQLEQSVIILSELLHNLTPDPSKSENSVTSKTAFLYKQASTLLNWLNLEKESPNDDLTAFPFPKTPQWDQFPIKVLPFPIKQKPHSDRSIGPDAPDIKLDQKIRAKIHHFSKIYSKHKLMMKKRHKLRETTSESFDVENKKVFDRKEHSLDVKVRTPGRVRFGDGRFITGWKGFYRDKNTCGFKLFYTEE